MTRYEFNRILGNTEQYNWFVLAYDESTRFELLTNDEKNHLDRFENLSSERFEQLEKYFHKNLQRFRFQHTKKTLTEHLKNFGYTPKYSGKTKTFYVDNFNPEHEDIIRSYYDVHITIKNNETI